MISHKSRRFVRSPLKYPGGKYPLLDRIFRKLPKAKRLIEPFCGSAVISLNAPFEECIVNDKNSDLINYFCCLKNGKQDFIEYARRLFIPENNTPEAYYFLRDEFNSTIDITYKSALLLYINRYGYNGILRYNKSGKLNTPKGSYQKPYFPEMEMREFMAFAQRATFLTADFEEVMLAAEKGDAVLADPPYVALSKTANFTTYSKGGFSDEDHERLARTAESLSARGVNVVICNHATKYTESLYENADKVVFPVSRTISCNSEKRNKVKEMLASF